MLGLGRVPKAAGSACCLLHHVLFLVVLYDRTRAAAYDLLVGLAHVMDEQDPGAVHDSDSDSEDGMDERQGGSGKVSGGGEEAARNCRKLAALVRNLRSLGVCSAQPHSCALWSYG